MPGDAGGNAGTQAREEPDARAPDTIGPEAGVVGPVEAEPTEVGEVAGEAAESLIGPEGGSVVSTDGELFVIVPEGALLEDTMIRIEPITNTAWGGVGGAFRLSPEGQEFEEPIELRFSYGDEELEGTAAEALRVAYQDEEGLWRALKEAELDADQQMIGVTTTHFSDWARFATMRIDPVYSMVLPTEKVELTVRSCLTDGTEGADDFSYLARCTTVAGADGVEDWAANGVPDGNQSEGRISGDAAGATYTAPALPPSENPVKVTASVIDDPGTVLTALVMVGLGGDQAEVWRGTVTQELSYSGSPDVMSHEMLTANVVFMGTNSSIGGYLSLTDGDYEADFLSMNSAYPCRWQGTESGDFPASGEGTIEFVSVPFEPATYDLELIIDEYFDGVNDCNADHIDMPQDDFGFVLGVNTDERPFDPTSSVIDDDFEVPHLDGTKRITVHLRKD